MKKSNVSRETLLDSEWKKCYTIYKRLNRIMML